MLHHYIQRGHDHSKLLNLSAAEKLFYKASMMLDKEEQREALVKGLVPSSFGMKGR